ncbi:unnamed protein product [Prorocentrum cordatum]|uniref:Zinc-ribbon domain-containing protein n=1 Tax=Prorocentrum cordatum TaxID=2364126 RepID=A0ABN9XYB5_9DINO|nr:unnamed protein product [Polarella glacialis]
MTMPMQEAPSPFVGMAVSPQAPGPRMVTCQNCGNECSSEHRFCAFCGSVIGGGGGGASSGAMPQHAAAMSHHAAAMPQMRQEAPEFMMPWGGPSLGPPMGPSQPFDRVVNSPWQQHHNFEAPDESRAWPGVPAVPPTQGGGGADSYYDSVNDEMDVVRGRMMLLAALKDMESREAAGGRG